MSKKDLSYYTSLPYKVEITPEEDGTGFNASIPDLKGCVAFGETVEEAYQIIAEIKQTWIEIALEQGWQIPEPTSVELKEYSGKFNVRLPRSLHRKLAELAKVESTSLNQLVVTFLAEGMGKWSQKHRVVQTKVVRPFPFEGFNLLSQEILSVVSTERYSKSTKKSSWALFDNVRIEPKLGYM